MKGKMISLSLLFLLLGIEGCKQESNLREGLVTLDVTVQYPTKDLMLQDFMDVEYIPLETDDNFITQGVVAAIGDQYMVIKNWSNDGDIFLFDRNTGKALRKINHRGQGDEEYVFINGITLDEKQDELFVNCATTKRILVYDTKGNFKRSFKHTENAEYMNVFSR